MGDTIRTATTPTRPLPIGAFPLPFGFLLLPPGDDTEPARQSLLAGRLPQEWPARLRGHQAALAGDHAAALGAFSGQDPVSRFNRFVLDPDAVSPDELRAGLGYPLEVLVDLVQFATGRRDTAPPASGHDGELEAMLLAANALPGSEGPAGPDSTGAVALLRRAVAAAEPASAALVGVLNGALAQACRQAGDPRSAITALEAGIGLLAGTDLAVGRAEQHLELASTYHELAEGNAGLLTRAVHHYHCALQQAGDEAPEVFAAAHAGLAAVYLTMPMVEASDQLRLGVAVGSLRAALTVYTRESHPAEWSSAQLNLANALVYAPSAHQGDNLAEAVDLYEAVLAARSRRDDPVGYARVLANQGNALAHLGVFGHARARLVEARSLFEETQQWDAAASVRELLDELGRQQGERETADSTAGRAADA
jgi:hypothetical protein